MGVEAESRGARGAEPLEREAGGEDTSNAIMAGVLGVGSVGVAIHAGGAGQNIDVAVELVCDTAPACEAVERLAQKKRAEWSRDLALRMVGLGPLLDSIKVEKEGLRLRATSSANVDALTSALGRMMKLRAPRGGPGPVRPPKPAPPTDDVVPSRPDAAAPSGRPSPSP
jgi:hypothetical protein